MPEFPVMLHYRSAPADLVRMALRDASGSSGRMKPCGLWLSDEGDFGWRQWCIAESFQLGNLTHVYEATIKPGANVIWINDGAQFDDFVDKFGCPLFDGGGPNEAIRWQQIMDDYDGILITPYFWNRRMDGGLWYYSWDCASACIWNTNIIETWTLKEVVDVASIEEEAKQREFFGV